MSRDDKRDAESGLSSQRVDALARSALDVLRKRPAPEHDQRCRAAAKWLLSACLSSDGFQLADVCAELDGRTIGSADIMDFCIPEVAQTLGAKWMQDELSFAQVTLGSARLHSLCKAYASEWSEDVQSLDRTTVIMVVPDGEDHVIGSVVLADQLRRTGRSVTMAVGCTPDEAVRILNADSFDIMLISCGTLETLEVASKIIQQVRARVNNVPPISLGGAVLDFADDKQKTTGADLVTNDISLTLRKYGREPLIRALMVAQ